MPKGIGKQSEIIRKIFVEYYKKFFTSAKSDPISEKVLLTSYHPI